MIMFFILVSAILGDRLSFSDDTRLCRTVTAGDFVSVAEWRAITIYIVEPLCISINSSAYVCWIVIGIRYMRLKLDREHYFVLRMLLCCITLTYIAEGFGELWSCTFDDDEDE
jgi:hypothetical protein